MGTKAATKKHTAPPSAAAEIPGGTDNTDLAFETKHYEDGTSATGVAPLPETSPSGAPVVGTSEALDKAPEASPVQPPKRHKRTKAEMQAAADAERLARLDPIEAMAEGIKRFDDQIANARANQELAETTLRELVRGKEEFLAEAKAKVDEFVIRATRALGLTE